VARQRTKELPNGKLQLARRTMNSLAIVLRLQGVSAADIRKLCLLAAKQAAAAPIRPVRIPASKDSALLGSALALWFRDSRFLDRAGLPKALKAYGRSPSVESLLRAASIRRNTKASVTFLAKSGLLSPTGHGKYIPTNRSARLPAIDGYFVEHISQGLMKLVETAYFNFTPKGKQQPLLQRAASVRELPRKYKAAFREYVNQQGNSFVTNIDDWMEARVPRSRRASKAKVAKHASIAAGVYAFAYIG